MTRPLNSRAISISFGIATSVLAWISIASYWSTQSLVRSFDSVSQAHQAIGKFQHIEVLLAAADSGVSAYVATADPSRLESFRYAKLVVPYELKQIDELLPANPAQRNASDSLGRMMAAHFADLSNVVTLRKSQGYEAAGRALASGTRSKREAMERLLSQIQQEEMTGLRQRWDRAREHSLKTKAFLALATLVSLALVGWIYGLLRRESAERRKAQTDKGSTETLLHSIIERIPYMILVKEAENLRIRVSNKAAEEWLGRSRVELLNSNEFDLRSKEEAQASMQTDRQALGEGKLFDTEERLLLPGKEERILHTQKLPVSGEEGVPSYVLSISEDITQRKQAERMLELSRDAAVEAARLRSEFIRNMSHEFRTPLSIVVGMCTLLLDTSLTSEQRHFAETVRRAAEGLSGLTKSILDFSKIESGSFALEHRALGASQIVNEVIAMMSAQAKAKGVNLVALVSHDIPSEVQGDPARLRQVLTQLLVNAVKFTERGEIALRVSVEKETESQIWLTWRITDTGIGIEEDNQKHLFEPFRQGDGSRTRRYGGTGLGLAMSKRIVELMGGTIGFESALARGSTFWFTLPFIKRHVHVPMVQVTSLPWTRARVLVVSENEASRGLLQQQLRDYALMSEAVSSGQTALEILRREAKAGRFIPIVLLDMHLADMDGVSFAQEVNNDQALGPTKIIVMTTGKSTMDVATASSLGFSGWLSLPPEPQELYERLAAAIDPQKPANHEHAA